MASFESLAAAFAAQFESRTRANGEMFDALKDGAPDWMGDAIRDAHGDMMPDDWKYAAARSIVDSLASGADPDDDMLEALDGLVDVYTGRLTAWLASNTTRVGYCDERAREFGPFDSVTAWLQAGQLCELDEIGAALVQAIRDQESDDDESDDA
jgi:hypothetical protein